MEKRKLYPIGKAAEICKVSPRALRYYEEKGLIRPDEISSSHYRYYTTETLRIVQLIRYYIDEGFSLQETEELLKRDSFDQLEDLVSHPDGENPGGDQSAIPATGQPGRLVRHHPGRAGRCWITGTTQSSSSTFLPACIFIWMQKLICQHLISTLIWKPNIFPNPKGTAIPWWIWEERSICISLPSRLA